VVGENKSKNNKGHKNRKLALHDGTFSAFSGGDEGELQQLQQL